MINSKEKLVGHTHEGGNLKTGWNKRKYQIFSSSVLKLIALVSMTIDHIGVLILVDILPSIYIGTFKLPLYQITRYVGRIAFPIYAFQVAEGYKYTKNKVKLCYYLLSHRKFHITMRILEQFIMKFKMFISRCF